LCQAFYLAGDAATQRSFFPRTPPQYRPKKSNFGFPQKIFMTLNPQFVTDKKGKKVAVQLSVKEYEFLLEELEMKEDIEIYKKVKADKNESYMPFEEYVKKRGRK